MSTASVNPFLDMVRAEIDLLVPDAVRPEDWVEFDRAIDLTVALCGFHSEEDARRVARLVVAGYDLAGKVSFNLLVEPATPKNSVELARDLFHACTALTAGTPADGPLPANVNFVTRRPNGIWWADNFRPPMAPKNALLFGVWLIALADPTLSDAVPMLLRVATR